MIKKTIESTKLVKFIYRNMQAIFFYKKANLLNVCTEIVECSVNDQE